MIAIIPSNARTEKHISNSDIIVSCIQGMSIILKQAKFFASHTKLQAS